MVSANTERNLRVRPDWAQIVEDLLKRQGRQNGWLARRLEMNRSQLSHIMHGDERYRSGAANSPQLTNLLVRIADVFEVPTYFFTEADRYVTPVNQEL